MASLSLGGDPVMTPAAAGDGIVAPRPKPPRVGDVPDLTAIRMIDNLGAVGLGPNLPGSRYAIVAGHLVRVEEGSGQILSVLRPLPHPPE